MVELWACEIWGFRLCELEIKFFGSGLQVHRCLGSGFRIWGLGVKPSKQGQPHILNPKYYNPYYGLGLI